MAIDRTTLVTKYRDFQSTHETLVTAMLDQAQRSCVATVFDSTEEHEDAVLALAAHYLAMEELGRKKAQGAVVSYSESETTEDGTSTDKTINFTGSPSGLVVRSLNEHTLAQTVYGRIYRSIVAGQVGLTRVVVSGD
jgi:hypothetical protein